MKPSSLNPHKLYRTGLVLLLSLSASALFGQQDSASPSNSPTAGIATHAFDKSAAKTNDGKAKAKPEGRLISSRSEAGPSGKPVANLRPADAVADRSMAANSGAADDKNIADPELPQLATDRGVLAAKISALADPLHKNALGGARPDALVADDSSDLPR